MEIVVHRATSTYCTYRVLTLFGQSSPEACYASCLRYSNPSPVAPADELISLPIPSRSRPLASSTPLAITCISCPTDGTPSCHSWKDRGPGSIDRPTSTMLQRSFFYDSLVSCPRPDVILQSAHPPQHTTCPRPLCFVLSQSVMSPSIPGPSHYSVHCSVTHPPP